MDAIYLMLLDILWLQDAKVSHDEGNNLVTIQGNGIINKIVVIKQLGSDTKWLEVLMCYYFQHGITNDEKDVMFTT